VTIGLEGTLLYHDLRQHLDAVLCQIFETSLWLLRGFGFGSK